jgi:hypothetical protein
MDFSIKELVRRGIFSVSVDEIEQELDLFKENGGQVS